MKLVNWCIYIYILLKPFYIGGSGTLQISDFLIVIAFFLVLFSSSRLRNKNNAEKSILSKLNYFAIFILSTIIINLIYFCFYRTIDFIMNIFYFIFIFMGLYVFAKKIYDKNVLKNIYYCFIIDIVLQLILYLLNIGETYGGVRYMGTFNDPNQFGFFIIMSISFIYTISHILNIKNKYICVIYLIALYLIYLSASTGMLLAIFTFFMIQFILNIKLILNRFRKIFPILCLVIFFMLNLGVIIYFFYTKNIEIKNKIDSFIENEVLNSSIITRLNDKTDKINEDFDNILEDRNLDKIMNNPIYLIFGAGQGKFERFGDGAGEIHSTFPSILFCYGIIPFLVLIYWIYINLRGLNLIQLSPYIAIFIESFTLLNQRQLLFWVFVILGNLYIFNKKE